MKRSLLLAAVMLSCCAGCLCYTYPTLTHTPELAVDNKDGSVHAFRVDIDRTDRKPLPPSTQYTLSSIPIDARGLIPSQLEVAAATGVYNPLGVVDGGQHERNQYTMLVRAYRPGYRLNEVKAWEKPRPLQWFPAPDILAQEKAIDDLLADPEAPQRPVGATGTQSGQNVTMNWWELKDQKAPPLGLQPGSVSLGQRKALEFAASEYQRLATTSAAGSPGMVTVRDRLQQKARWLSDYAARPPVEVR